MLFRSVSQSRYDKVWSDILLPYAKHWCGNQDVETLFDLNVSDDRLRDVVGGAIDDSLAKTSVRENLSASLLAALGPQVNHFDDLMSSIGESSNKISDLANKASNILEDTSTKLSPIFENLVSMTGAVSSLATTVLDSKSFLNNIPFLSSLPSAWWESFSSGDVLYLIQMYILYANCTSWAVRSILVEMVVGEGKWVNGKVGLLVLHACGQFFFGQCPRVDGVDLFPVVWVPGHGTTTHVQMAAW